MKTQEENEKNAISKYKKHQAKKMVKTSAKDIVKELKNQGIPLKIQIANYNRKDVQDKMIAAMIATGGVVLKSCHIVGIDCRTHYRWLKEYSEYAEEVNNCKDIFLDIVENKLMELIEEKNIAAVIFALKCKGKGRNWTEKSEQTVNHIQTPIPIQIVYNQPQALPINNMNELTNEQKTAVENFIKILKDKDENSGVNE